MRVTSRKNARIELSVRSSASRGDTGLRRLPAVRKQLFDPTRRVALDAGEHVRQVRDRVHAILFAGGDEGVEAGGVVPGLFISDEEVVGPAEGDPAQAGLRDVVVRWDRGEAQEAAESAMMTQEIPDGLAHRRSRL